MKVEYHGKTKISGHTFRNFSVSKKELDKELSSKAEKERE